MDIDRIASELRALAEQPDNSIYRALGTWLAHCLIDGEHSAIRVDLSPWDVSSYGAPTGEPFDLSQYLKVGEFLDGEATGSTIATYVSGSGFAAEMYSERFDQLALEAFSKLVFQDYPELRDLDDPGVPRLDDDAYEQLLDAGVDESLFAERFRSWPLMDTYTKYLQYALQERAEEQRKAEELHQQRERLRSFAGDAIAEINQAAGGTRWEKANWDTLRRILSTVCTKYGKDRVGAALLFCNLNTSVSVQRALAEKYPAPQTNAR